MEPLPPVDPTVRPSGAKRLLHRVGMTSAGRWYGMRVASQIDPGLLRLTGGRFATTSFFPLVLMTVPGRRSGQLRTVTLVYFTDGDEVILTASSFGREKHPAWYLNAKAAGEVELRAGGRGGRYVVRETEGAERDRLFELSTTLYAGYGLYQERVSGRRTIPVLALRHVPSLVAGA